MRNYAEHRKMRVLNAEYMRIVEQVKKNRADARRYEVQREALANSLWEADAALTAAHQLDEDRARDYAIQAAQDDLERAEEAIRKVNLRYESTKEELEELKKQIGAQLDKIRRDPEASRKVDTVLLMRFERDREAAMRNMRITVDFLAKLGKIQDNLTSGGVQDVEGIAIQREYDSTLASIASFTDMIQYFEELEARLRSETVEELQENGELVQRKKSAQERERDVAAADDLLSLEIRPRRLDRAKARGKLGEIIVDQARRVDLDPRDLEDIQSVEDMLAKRNELNVQLARLEMVIDRYNRLIRHWSYRTSGGIIRRIKEVVAQHRRKKRMEMLARKALEDGQVPEELLASDEEEDTEEERFTYRFYITQRELNRRYNRCMGIKDNITEHAYSGGDEDEA